MGLLTRRLPRERNLPGAELHLMLTIASERQDALLSYPLTKGDRFP